MYRWVARRSELVQHIRRFRPERRYRHDLVPLPIKFFFVNHMASDLNSVDHPFGLSSSEVSLPKLGLPCFKIFLEFVKLYLSCNIKSIRAF